MKISDKQSWDVANDYVGKFKKIPSLFTAPIRALMLDSNQSRASANPASQFLVMRLLRSPTFKAIFYHAAMTFKMDDIASFAFLSSYDLVRLYQPADLASIIGTIFTYRKINAMVGDSNHIKQVIDFKSINSRVELAVHLGLTVPNIGVRRTIIAAGIPFYCQAMFALEKEQEFLAYKKHLNKKRMLWDLEYEFSHWSTTSLHIAARLLQQLGFGVPLTTLFHESLSRSVNDYTAGKKDELGFQVVNFWLTSLLQTGEAPQEPILGAFYPLQKELYKLLFETSIIREKASKHNWLERTKADISPHATPQLYQEVLAELVQTDDVRQFMSENLPTSMVESLSDEEIKEIAQGKAEIDE